MVQPKVLLLGTIDHAHKAWTSLSQVATIVHPKSTTRSDFITELQSGALADILAIYRTFDSFAVTGPFDAHLISYLPASLKYISHNGAGYDQISIPACTARGIQVSNTPTAVDDATADMGLFLMLGALRNLPVGMAALRRGEWRGKPGHLPKLGHDPQGKVLGIIGMGGIGRNFAKKCSVAFGMKVLYYNRSRLASELEREAGGAEYVDMERLLRQSEIISLNLPLNPHTRHTISTPQFALMRPGVVIVNTARGAVMDEAALVKALDEGIVASAGLDVYEDEPVIHPGLMANDRVLLVPHMGTLTVETQTKMEEWTISNVVAAVEGRGLRSIVPEQREMS